MIEHLISEPVVAFQLLGPDAVTRLLDIVGPEDPEDAKAKHPESLRAIYGIDKIRNAIYVSKTSESSENVSTSLNSTHAKIMLCYRCLSLRRILAYYLVRNLPLSWRTQPVAL